MRLRSLTSGVLTRGDYAEVDDVDFLGVVEHGLIRARVRQEWSRPRKDGIHSVWAFASQRHFQVGQLGAGLVSVKGALVFLPTFATSQCKGFFLRKGRAVRAALPLELGGGGEEGVVCTSWLLVGIRALVMILKRLPGLVFCLMLCLELVAVAGRQSKLNISDFNVEPNLIPCLRKGILNGILEEAWACAGGESPSVSCKKCLGSTAGSRRDCVVPCTVAAASLISCEVRSDRWV